METNELYYLCLQNTYNVVAMQLLTFGLIKALEPSNCICRQCRSRTDCKELVTCL